MWVSRERQIAAIVLVVGALIALVFEVSAVFWVLIVLSLGVFAFDMWRRSSSRE